MTEYNSRLGEFVCDRVFGFTGLVIAQTDYIYEATKLLVAPKALDSNGKPVEPVWFSSAQCKTVEKPKTVAPGLYPITGCV